MIWLWAALLAAAVLAPLALTLRGRSTARGARDMAIALHREQLAELDRDLAENRILPAEHANAVLEVQRRLLATAAGEEAPARTPGRTGGRLPVVAALGIVPALALAIYLLGGRPGMPSVTGTDRAVGAAEEALLIGQLREQLAAMDPGSDRTREGYVLLGNAEAARGHDMDAAAAWRRALAIRFDPTLAVQAGAAELRAKGTVDGGIADLFRQALAAAPDAPWRAAVEERLKDFHPGQ